MAWHLDTNIVIFCLRGRSPITMRRLQAVAAADIRLSLQVHAELFVGAAKSSDPLKSKAHLQSFIAPFKIAWPDAVIEEHYVQSE